MKKTHIKNLDGARETIDYITQDYSWPTEYEVDYQDDLLVTIEIGNHTLELCVHLYDEDGPMIVFPGGDSSEKLDYESFWRQAFFHALEKR